MLSTRFIISNSQSCFFVVIGHLSEVRRNPSRRLHNSPWPGTSRRFWTMVTGSFGSVPPATSNWNASNLTIVGFSCGCFWHLASVSLRLFLSFWLSLCSALSVFVLVSLRVSLSHGLSLSLIYIYINSVAYWWRCWCCWCWWRRRSFAGIPASREGSPGRVGRDRRDDPYWCCFAPRVALNEKSSKYGPILQFQLVYWERKLYHSWLTSL